MWYRFMIGLVALTLMGPATGAFAQSADQPRQAPIVGGKRIQPHADEFSGPNTKPDVPPAEAKDLDALYQQILHDSAEPLDSGGSGNPPGKPPANPSKPR
ncbi:MAG TPA: hypothetical protein VMC10_00490 [Stellaceae bacterium]|nr:hypothetical protein [Stellaceae bacterium]